MMAAGSRQSGLDIPIVEMAPVLHEGPAQDMNLGTLEPGALIADRYRVLRKIGEGGMGVLYACEDTVLIRQVAVKLMQRSIAADPQLSERLLREARLAAQLKKHVAQVFDCGTLVTGEPYIVMELLHGRDLYSVLKESGPLSPEHVIANMLDLCVGLAEAHEKGIIHRDLKPENLYLSAEPDGSVVLKIVDFGVSKQLTSRHFRSQTNPTESVGSPQYMSPEQITTPSEVDPRTDIWSLGVVMFELLTGSVPFNGAGPAQVCAAVLTHPIPPISDFRSDVPAALQAIIARCLERDRNRRFASVRELAAALQALIAPPAELDEPSSTSSVSVMPKVPRGRRWLGAFCAVLVLGGCLTVLGVAVRDGHIRVPSAADVQRLPERISAWKLPFLTPAPAREPAPERRLGSEGPPSVPLEQRPLEPAAPAQLPSLPSAAPVAAPPGAVASSVAPSPALSNVQAHTPTPRAPKSSVRPHSASPSAPSLPSQLATPESAPSVEYPTPVPPMSDSDGPASSDTQSE